MENRKVLVLITLFFILLAPVSFAHAYAVSTHYNLHKNILREYQKLTGTSFSSQEKEAFLQGAIAEDDDPRYINHFFDPIHNRGFKDKRPSSLQWASNPYIQGNFTHWHNDKGTKLFAYPQDYTFERAVYEYAHGDKKRAMEALGHVMHLLEDLTSVPHTRDDSHSGSWFDGPSYYEDYTAGKVSNVTVHSIKRYKDIDSLFKALALYTNHNFLSRDTVFENYVLPKMDMSKIKGDFMYNKVNSKLVFVDYEIDRFGNKYINQTKLNNPTVMQDYWAHLSRKAVDSGVALLDLFFREVEKEKKTGTLATANISYTDAKTAIDEYDNRTQGGPFAVTGLDSVGVLELDNMYERLSGAYLADEYYHIMSAQERLKVANALKEYESYAGVPKRTQFASALNAFDKVPAPKAPAKPTTKPKPAPKSAPQKSKKTSKLKSAKIPLKPEQIKQKTKSAPAPKPKQQKLALTPVQLKEVPDKSTRTPDPSPSPSPFAPGGYAFGAGGGGAQSNSKPEEPSLFLKLTTQNLTTRQDTMQIQGETNADTVILSIKHSTTTVSINNNNFTQTISLQEGENIISVIAKKGNQEKKETLSITKDSTPPQIVLSAQNCINSNPEDICLVFPGDVNISWRASEAERVFLNNATTSISSSTTITLADNETNLITIKAQDALLNTSIKQLRIIANSHPLTINEIASGADSWVEVYNNSSSIINLDSWNIIAGEATTTLSGFLDGGKYAIFSIAPDNFNRTIMLKNGTTTFETVHSCLQQACDTEYSLEKYEPFTYGDDAKWKLNNGYISNADNIKATPGERNSINYEIDASTILSKNKTLTKANSPYLITDSGFVIPEGKTLEITDGVVIKMANPNSRLTVHGTLKSIGAEDSHIVFTSLKDDTFAGDTNFDKDKTAPEPGDWGGIIIYSDGSSFNYTDLLYGGNPGLPKEYMNASVYAQNASFDMNNTRISFSKENAVSLNDSASTINHSFFTDNNFEGRYSAGLRVVGKSDFKLMNSEFKNNKIGLHTEYVESNGFLVKNNKFIDNKAEAIRSHGRIGSYSENSASGNLINGITFESTAVPEDESVTLHHNQIPYVLTNTVYINGELNIDPGVIIKGFADMYSPGDAVKNKGHLIVYGNLNINGTSESPVIFTSVLDDDIKGEGITYATELESPNHGDWKGISVINNGKLAQANIKHTKIKYAGYHRYDDYYGAINSSGEAHLTIEDSVIKDNVNYGILLQKDGVLTIKNTKIENSYTGIQLGKFKRRKNRAAFASLYDMIFENNANLDIAVKGIGSKLSCNTAQCNAQEGKTYPDPLEVELIK